MQLSAKKISEILDAKLVVGSPDAVGNSVFTDTRKPGANGIFIALRGENFNGDQFAGKALEEGASIAIVQEWSGGEIAEGKAVIEVPETLFALQRLAHWWRSQLDIPVICITGSNGKTSTKDFAAAILSQAFNVNATKGNLNNHIGLPLTVLSTTEEHTAAIFEIGMNHGGELSPLCEIARPKFGVITNIGSAHIEFLGSREAIAEEKGTLARYLPEDGLLFTPAGCEFNEYFRARTRSRLTPVGNGRGLVRAENLRLQPDGTRFTLVIDGEDSAEVFLPVPGKHMVTNALLAAALGWKLGIPPEKIAQGLSSTKLTTGRMRRIEWEGITLYDDTYNANPESMEAAIETLADTAIPKGAKRIVVLGKMGELGVYAEAAHLKIGKLAADKGLTLIAVGEGAEGIAEGGSAPHFTDIHSAADWLLENAGPGDVVLFKGSRTAAIEKVLQTAFPAAFPTAC
ncbi:MAG: UDP-N-acetylmuramoyl-tripeptide--D-alanyl-D-alanine ligase [Verrucomicrobia bacterium]|nr:UDP-N-acetylmuramoyl-tripeptide--D-alanyl-D-alanine ligase [Verrucomicrobiota bacterium]|tara:strand:+ start:9449 stop:10822 length:1374 start_codon:yes stop_codon:yes gene_type:complete